MLGKRIKHSKTETPGSSRKRSSLKADQSERPQFLVSLVDRFLSLQRTIGNHAVAQFVKANVVLPSLGGSKNVAVQREEVNPLADRDILPEDNQQTASNNSQKEIYWGASAAAISSMTPQPVHWGSNNSMSQAENEKKGFFAIGPPKKSDLETIQSNIYKKGNVGHTENPSSYRAPDFEFNTWDAGIARKGFFPILSPLSPPLLFLRKALLLLSNTRVGKWYARPTLTVKAFEGNSVSLYTAAGTYPTEYREKGKKVYWHFSAHVSDKIRDAELEHCNDFKYAYKISLKEAEEVLTAKVIGKRFGPASTEVAVKQMVLDAIEDNLIHKQLGNDKTKWETKYQQLMPISRIIRDGRTSLFRSGTNLHKFPPDEDNSEDYKGGIKYNITDKYAKINQIPSSAIVKYDPLPKKHSK